MFFIVTLATWPFSLCRYLRAINFCPISRELANRKIADICAIRITWHSRDTLMSTLEKNKRQKWQEKTRIALRERESNRCFLMARACVSIIAPDLIYDFARVSHLKRIIFSRSARIQRRKNSRLNWRTESTRLKTNSHARWSTPEQSIVNCNLALGSLKAFV